MAEYAAEDAGVAGGREVLLAVDLGLRCGLAWWVRDAQGVGLVRHRCTEFHTRTRLKAAVRGVLGEVGGLGWVVGEGDRGLWEIWRRGAALLGAETVWVSPERWRTGLFGERGRDGMGGKALKAAARLMVEGSGERRGGRVDRGLLGRFGERARVPLRTDAAEAVCLGYWAARDRGWFGESE
jgi:hypothetical protein